MLDITLCLTFWKDELFDHQFLYVKTGDAGHQISISPLLGVLERFGNSDLLCSSSNEPTVTYPLLLVLVVVVNLNYTLHSFRVWLSCHHVSTTSSWMECDDMVGWENKELRFRFTKRLPFFTFLTTIFLCSGTLQLNTVRTMIVP